MHASGEGNERAASDSGEQQLQAQAGKLLGAAGSDAHAIAHRLPGTRCARRYALRRLAVKAGKA